MSCSCTFAFGCQFARLFVEEVHRIRNRMRSENVKKITCGPLKCGKKDGEYLLLELKQRQSTMLSSLNYFQEQVTDKYQAKQTTDRFTYLRFFKYF